MKAITYAIVFTAFTLTAGATHAQDGIRKDTTAKQPVVRKEPSRPPLPPPPPPPPMPPRN